MSEGANVDGLVGWIAREKGSGAVPGPLRFEDVYSANLDFTFATLQRLGVKESDLEDMLQKVFLDVHQRLHTFDQSASLKGWIYGICKKEYLNYRRIAHRRRELTQAEPIDVSTEGTVPCPDEFAQRREAEEQLGAMLDELDPDKRTVFVMFEIDELPCEEIAEELGIPIGTVYSRLHAARKDFRKALVRHNARGARTRIQP